MMTSNVLSVEVNLFLLFFLLLSMAPIEVLISKSSKTLQIISYNSDIIPLESWDIQREHDAFEQSNSRSNEDVLQLVIKLFIHIFKYLKDY
jgi:hypothetical protein